MPIFRVLLKRSFCNINNFGSLRLGNRNSPFYEGTSKFALGHKLFHKENRSQNCYKLHWGKRMVRKVREDHNGLPPIRELANINIIKKDNNFLYVVVTIDDENSFNDSTCNISYFIESMSSKHV